MGGVAGWWLGLESVIGIAAAGGRPPPSISRKLLQLGGGLPWLLQLGGVDPPQAQNGIAAAFDRVDPF
jgi:hypothetical protein